MRYTVHQPMLFAPIYLWARFASVEVLVLLDEDYMKADGWHTKFKIQTKNGPVVIAAPIKDRFGTLIKHAQFAEPDHFFKKVGKTLAQTYGKTPYYAHVSTLIAYKKGETFGQYCSRVTRNLAQYLDLPLIIFDVGALDIPRPTSASQWLANIGQVIGGTEYVCAGDATQKYLNIEPFDYYQMKISPQQYTMPAYGGQGDATTSILDLVFTQDPINVQKILALQL